MRKGENDNWLRFIASHGSSVWPACITCVHKHSAELGCNAFPDVVPESIADGTNRHTSPFPGDHGIQYKKAE